MPTRISIAAAIALSIGCGYKTPGERARDYARSITPDSVRAAEPPAPVDPQGRAVRSRIVSVRIWADQDYRRRPRWKEHVRDTFERANEVVAPLGVRFDPTALREWERTSEGGQLPELLIELEGLDEGERVDWVVGLTTAFGVLESSAQHLGMARILGRHFVVRDMTDLGEHDAIRDGLHLLSEEEQRSLYSKRLAHKELVALLHEWGHVLGALHMRDREWIMNPAYDHRAVSFSPFNRGLLEIGLRHHLRDGPADPAAWREELVAWVRAHPEARVNPDERERVLAGELGGDDGEAVRLSSRDLRTFNRAVSAVNAGDAEEAWHQIELLLGRHRDNGRVMALACHVAARRQDSSRAVDLCRVAAMVDEKSPAALLTLAHLALTYNDRAEALAHVRDGDARLHAQRQPNAAACLDTAGVWLALDELTATERNLACASAGERRDELTRLALEARRQWGLPPAADLGEPGSEHAYVTAMRATHGVVWRDPQRGAREASALAEEYPAATGPLALLCAARLAQRRAGEARRLCRRGLDVWNETALAHFGLAQIALSNRDTRAAKSALERAVELGPGFGGAWVQLGRLYRTQGDTAALADLGRRYRARFNQELPAR